VAGWPLFAVLAWLIAHAGVVSSQLDISNQISNIVSSSISLPSLPDC